MRTIFEDPTTEGIILVDASNAFNSLNRRVALTFRYSVLLLVVF